jgi:hypothetical protein
MRWYCVRMQAQRPLDSSSKAMLAVTLGHSLAQLFLVWLIYFLEIETVHFDLGWGGLLVADIRYVC